MSNFETWIEFNGHKATLEGRLERRLPSRKMRIELDSDRGIKMKWKCFFGFHDLEKDNERINGVWWAFCRRCGCRFAGEYDMATGDTIWERR